MYGVLLRKTKKKTFWLEYSLFVLAAVVVILAYFCLFTPIRVEILLAGPPQRNLATEADCPYPEQMQLFYAPVDGGYSEKRSQHFRMTPDQAEYSFIVGNYKLIDSLKAGLRLRFDPMMYGGDFFLREIVIHQPGYRTVRINHDTGFQYLRPVNDIDSLQMDDQGLVIHSTGCDPQLEILLTPRDISFDYGFLFRIAAGTVVVASLLYLLLFWGGLAEYGLVPCLMSFALALIFAMAALNQGVIHSDEIVHLRAGQYYEQHWAPPEICAPDTKKSYSVFGVSRLDSFEISYFFAGKFARLLSWFTIDDLHANRYFNVFLFLILVLLSGRYATMRLLVMSLLISPQVWYLYSYCNSDAFALTVITLVAYQAVAGQSMTNRFLTARLDNASEKIQAVLVCLLFALLLFLKPNYYVFIIFLGLFFLYRLWTGYYEQTGLVLRRVVIIALVAAALFGVRWGMDVHLNGFHRSAKRQECRIQRAEHFFNPATPLAKRYPFLRLKERQVPLRDLFEKHNWGFKTFVHSFGVYFITPLADLGLFKFFMAALAGFGLFIIGSICLHRQWRHLILLGMVLFCSALLIALSLWNSWVASFQAQGRYLFPILTMTAILVAEMRSYLNRKLLCGFVLLFFGVSAYSFIFVGMRQLLAGGA